MMTTVILKALSRHTLSHLILTIILKGKYFNYLHVANKEIEAFRNSRQDIREQAEEIKTYINNLTDDTEEETPNKDPGE